MTIPAHLIKFNAEDKGKYYSVVCPSCGQHEGFVFKDSPYRILCNRKGKCGATTNVDSNKDNKDNKNTSLQIEAHIPQGELETELSVYRGYLEASPTAKEYLCKKRGISIEVINNCDVGWDGKESIVFGIRTIDGYLSALKFRNIYTKSMYQKGSNAGTFMAHRIDFNQNMYFVEGEMDLLTMCSLGFFNVVCFRGASWSDTVIDASILKTNTKIAFVSDQDVAGLEAQAKWADKFGFERCYPITLPKKDINDCLTNGFIRKDLIALLEKAQPFPLPGMTSVSDVKSDLLKNPELPVVMLPFQEFNYLMGGLMPGELTILSGLPSVGKTSFAVGCAKFWARHGSSVVICPLETSKKKLTKQYLSDFTDNGKIQFFEPVSTKLFTNAERLTTYFKSLKARYDMKVFILDHLEWVAQEQKEEQHKAIDNIMKNFVTACKASGTHAVLLHHLRRGVQFPRQDGTVVSRKPMLSDLSYAGEKVAANVLFIHRDIDPQTNSMSNSGLAELILSKNRENGTTGSVIIEYDKSRGGYVV
jgi:ribosomal protein S27E